MLSNASVETLLSPVSEALPCGEDLEYDPAFMALLASAQAKAEQQFGDTVIAAVEPDWPVLIGKATDLLHRTKDIRVAMLALRAATHTQGIAGLSLGLSLLLELLERFWSTIHPQLDAQDNNDATMRLNALAPLADASMVLRDLYDCAVGTSRSMGTVRVRDIAIANNKLAGSHADAGYTAAQIEGALQDIHAANPEALQAAVGVAALAKKLETLIESKTGRADHIDLKPLHSITGLLHQVCSPISGSTNAQDEASTYINANGIATHNGPVRGEISTRQEALQMLDKVALFLEKTEPGNPAPLLIQRAKRLVGVSFIDIMTDLAPDALGSIQNITGKPS